MRDDKDQNAVNIVSGSVMFWPGLCLICPSLQTGPGDWIKEGKLDGTYTTLLLIIRLVFNWIQDF